VGDDSDDAKNAPATARGGREYAGSVAGFIVPGTVIRLDFKQAVGKTGTNLPLLFVASKGTRSRGIVIKLADVLLWEMKPKPTEDADYPSLAAQLAIPHLQALMRDPDAFFSQTNDEELLLNRDNSSPTWNPEQNLLT